MAQPLPPLGVRFSKTLAFVLSAIFLLVISLPAAVHVTGFASSTTPIDKRLPAPLPAIPRTWEIGRAHV